MLMPHLLKHDCPRVTSGPAPTWTSVSHLLVAALVLPILAMPVLARAAQDDRLCLGRVCLGDDVLNLSQVPWEPVKSPVGKAPLADTRLAPEAKAWVERRFRWTEETFNSVAPYLLLRKFDAEGFRALRGIVAVCEGFSIGDSLRATYVSQEGHKTVVTFEPVAGANYSKPRFLVSRISRLFGEVTADSLHTIRARIADRYARYPTYASATRAGVRFLESGDHGPTLTLLQPYGGEAIRGKDLRNNAACAADSERR